MAEIKSTLDLVMERTKHLTMSTEEKTGQRKMDFEKKLNGLLQQYADKALSVEELMEKVTGLQTHLPTEDHSLPVSAVIRRIRPGRDNTHWLSLVMQMAPDALRPLEDALADYRDKDANLARQGEQRFLKKLDRDHAIHGAAVAPNLCKDVTLQGKRTTLETEAIARIEDVIQRII